MPVVDYEVMDRKDDHASLVLRGELADDTPSKHLKGELERHYVDDGVREIRVDLEGLTSITLEGVATLLELWRESNERGKHFVVHDARGPVLRKLKVTGVLGILGG
jgi:anti-anti-sigma factor